MSELRFLSKKDAVLNIKSFCETLSNAKNHLNYSNQKSDVETYLKLLDIYSKKIDLDLNNSIMSLRLALAQNYGNAQCFDIEGMKWIDKWYTNFKTQTEYSIASLPNSQEYQPILDSFGASMEEINQRFEKLEKKYEGLEKKISQPQQIPQKQSIPQQANIPQQLPPKKTIQQTQPLLEDIIIQGQKYQLKSSEYNALMDILAETGTRIEEVQGGSNFNKGFYLILNENSINTISINRYNLNKIPKGIYQLTQLQKLNLGFNQIREIPKEIGQLTQLQELYLRSNQIKEIPKEIGQLTQLRHLWLEYNQIVEIPKEVKQLKYLTIYI